MTSNILEMRSITKVFPGVRALDNVSLNVARGEIHAICGENGAGKSTLIKQIGGVEIPDSGRIIRRMTNSWPIGFNGGFQGSLTGYDNARFIARIYGKSYSGLRDFVEDFTELGSSLKMPVKTYSSGMRARLAFALSLGIEFDCYLIDEVLAAGDGGPQRLVEAVDQRHPGRDVQGRDVLVGDAVEVLDEGAQGVAVRDDQHRATGAQVLGSCGSGRSDIS